MLKQIISIWFGLCVLLTACMPQENARETISSEVKLSTSTATEEKTSTELSSSTPTGTVPVINTATNIISPVFVFLEGDTLMEQVGSNAPEHLVDLPEFGSIKGAILVRETLYLLREQGFQRIHISDGTSDLVLRFDMPLLEGGLIYVSNYPRIFYYGTESEQITLIGYFVLDEDVVHPVLSIPQNLKLLGMTENGQGLYCLPLGQDPEFIRVLVIDLEQGEISKEIPIQGTLFAALASDSRRLATFAQRMKSTGLLESVIHLYDLPSLPLTPPRVFTLPNAPSYVGFGGFRWSPDSQRLYFMLVENIYEAPATSSYGLWRLDVESGATDLVAPISDPIFHTVSISPDGEWIVLMHETRDEAILVQLGTGEVESFSAPVHAILVGWR